MDVVVNQGLNEKSSFPGCNFTGFLRTAVLFSLTVSASSFSLLANQPRKIPDSAKFPLVSLGNGANNKLAGISLNFSKPLRPRLSARPRFSALESTKRNVFEGYGANRASKVVRAGTLQSFLKEVTNEKSKNVVVIFHSEYCQLCKKTLPRFEKLAKDNPSTKFVSVNIDATSGVSKLCQEFCENKIGRVTIPCGQLYKKPGDGEVNNKLIMSGSIGYKVTIEGSNPFEEFKEKLQTL